MAFLLPLRSNSGFSGHTVWKGGAATEAIPVWHRPGGCVRVRRPSSHLCHGATGQRNSACVQKRSSKKLQKVTFSKPSFRTFFTAVMVALCTTFSSDSRVPQKAQKSSEIHRFRNFFGPSVEIRTRGLLNPIQARYQTSPHPDILLCLKQPT